MRRKAFATLVTVIIGVGLTVFVPSANSTVELVQCSDPEENPVLKDPNFVIALPWGPGLPHHVMAEGGYGTPDEHINDCDPYWAKDYYALDFDLELNESVRAVASGTVQFAGWTTGGWDGYGQAVYIDHENGYRSFYAHLNSVDVSVGQPVTQGQHIGKAGRTSDRDIPVHLHFALYHEASIAGGPYGGKAVLPEPFMGAEEYTNIHPGMELVSAGSPTLNFTVRLQGRPGNHSANVTIEVRNPGSTQPVIPPQTVKTGSNGQYNGLELTGIPPGNYDIFAKTRASLRGAIFNRTLHSGTNTLDFGTLLVGDLNGDNKVNSIDNGILFIGWEDTVSNPQPCPNDPEDCHKADFNLDSKVNSIDHGYVFSNWGREGQGGLGGQVLTAPQQIAPQPASPTSGDVQVKITHESQDWSSYHNVGETFDLDIEIRTRERKITGLDLIAHYDRCVLEVLDVIPGSIFPSYVISPIDPSSGEIEISAESSVSSPLENGNYFDVFATIRFRVKMNAPNELSVVYPEYKFVSTVDSNAAEYGSAADVLAPPLDHVLHLQGSPQREGITGEITSPTSGAYVNRDRIPVLVDVTEQCAEVNSVSFDAYYDGSWHSVGLDQDGSDGWSIVWDASTLADQVVDISAHIYEYAYSEGRENEGIILDRTPPRLESYSFSPPSPSGPEIIRIDAGASDNLAGVDHIDVYVNTATDGSTSGDWNHIGTIDGESGYVDWNTAGYEAGEHRIVFDIRDNAGNWDLWTFGSQPTVTYVLHTTELAGQIGGPTNAVVVQDNFAYLGVGPRMVVLDVLDPTHPKVVGQTSILPDDVSEIYLTGSYAYVAAGDAGLRIIDISDPASPVEVGVYDTDTSDRATDVYVVSDYAYIAAGGARLRLVDVSNPAAPKEVSFYDIPGSVTAVHVVDSSAFVSWKTCRPPDDCSGGLRVIDVSDPSTLTEVGSYDMPEWANDVYVVGGYAYVAAGDGLRVVDITNPSSPVEVGSTLGNAQGVYLVGSYAYVADGGAGLRVVDVSEPAAPVEVGSYDTPYLIAYGVYVDGGYAYVVAGWVGGLQVVDVSDSTTPIKVGGYEPPRNAYDVHVAGSYAYVADAWGGMQVVDVSNPSAPKALSSYNMPNVFGVYIVGSYAYVANGGAGLRVLGVWDPSAPVEVGAYPPDSPALAIDVHVADGYAYVVNTVPASNSILWILDISDPTAPVKVSSYEMLSEAQSIYVVSGYAYIAGEEAGLRVVDVTDPSVPVEVDSYNPADPSAFVTDVYVNDGYAYVAAGDAGLRIVDISDPTSLVEVGSYSAKSATGIYVLGKHAYMIARSGLRVLDISDPTNPVEIGYYYTTMEAWDIYVSGTYAYVADGDEGLLVLRYTGEVACYDLNGSGQVDAADLQAVAFLWHQEAGAPYDQNGDNVITILDIMMVAAHWGESCGIATP